MIAHQVLVSPLLVMPEAHDEDPGFEGCLGSKDVHLVFDVDWFGHEDGHSMEEQHVHEATETVHVKKVLTAPVDAHKVLDGCFGQQKVI